MRWMALESLESNKFTLKTDIWSFGVVLFEIFSYGATPYGELNTLIIGFKIADGLRPDKPTICPDDLYALMKRCWDAEPDKRPSFQAIAREIARMLITAEKEVPMLRDMGELVKLAKSLEKGGAKTEDDGYSHEPTASGYSREEDVIAAVQSAGLVKTNSAPVQQYVNEAMFKFTDQREAVPQVFDEEQLTFSLPPGVPSEAQWYYGPISRTTAERILLTCGRPSGAW